MPTRAAGEEIARELAAFLRSSEGDGDGEGGGGGGDGDGPRPK